VRVAHHRGSRLGQAETGTGTASQATGFRCPSRIARSAPAGDEGGDDVARVTVQIAPGTVVSGGRPRISVTSGDLDVPQRHPGVECGGDEAVGASECGEICFVIRLPDREPLSTVRPSPCGPSRLPTDRPRRRARCGRRAGPATGVVARGFQTGYPPWSRATPHATLTAGGGG